MKAKHFHAAFLLLFCTASMWASYTSVDGIWYDFDNATMTASVTYYGSAYFDNNNEYTGSVIIPSSVVYNGNKYDVTGIGQSAFQACTNLTSITIPNSVTSIANYAFYGCAGIKSITIPKNITYIGYQSFYGCKGITAVIWNAKECASPAYSGAGYIPFNNICTQIKTFVIGNSVKNIPNSLCAGMTNLTSISIPSSVVSIGSESFNGCSGINSIVIPNNVASLGRGAFSNCTGLMNVTIGNNVTSIGDDAFYNCTNITTLTIPNSITNIGNFAFSYCSVLRSVQVESSTPATLGSDVFKNTSSSLAIMVPCGSLQTYKNANGWKGYSIYLKYAPSNVNAVSLDKNKGSVLYPKTICDNTISATPNYGYHFVQWSDGNTENPRTIDPTENKTYTAEYKIALVNDFMLSDLSLRNFCKDKDVPLSTFHCWVQRVKQNGKYNLSPIDVTKEAKAIIKEESFSSCHTFTL